MPDSSFSKKPAEASQQTPRIGFLAVSISGIAIIIEAIAFAIFLQLMISTRGYDRFVGPGLIIILLTALILFLANWLLLSALAARLSEDSIKSQMARFWPLFLPVAITIPYFFMPNYNQQNIGLFCFFGFIVLTPLNVIALFHINCKTANVRDLRRVPFLMTIVIVACNLALLLAGLKIHDLYLEQYLRSNILRAKYDNTSLQVIFTKAPGKFTWKAKVPAEGVFQVSAILNQNFHRKLSKKSAEQNTSIRVRNRKGGLSLSAEFGTSGVAFIKEDISTLAGETTIFEFEMLEPFSIGAFLGRIHTLLRPTSWLSSKQEAVDLLVPAYWGRPIIYHPRKPEETNVVLIIVDTLRVDHMGCYGYGFNTTPNIGEMARRGVLFENAISQAPWTLPSTASILTSLLPISHGAGPKKAKLSEQRVMAGILKEHGYYTAGFIHNPYISTLFGMDQGFDEFHTREKDARSLSDSACAWLEANSDKKFFCLLFYFDPHAPRFLHRELDEEIRKGAPHPDPRLGWEKVYDSEIAFADFHIGRVFDKLEQLDLLENTLIAFVADHGEEFGEHGFHGHATGHMYDELLHVPLIMAHPPSLPDGRIVKQQVRSFDILPTVLDILDIELADNALQGKSLISLVTGDSDEDMIAISESCTKKEAKSLRMGNYKIILSEASGKSELYDLSKDPLEKHNLSEDEPEIREALLSQLKENLEKSSKQFSRESETPILDEETKQTLKALGYID